LGAKILPAKNINRIRVLHITSSLKVGGAETVLVSLLRELQNSKIDPKLLDSVNTKNSLLNSHPVSPKNSFKNSALGLKQASLEDSLPGCIFENRVLYFHAGPNLLKLEKMGITAQQARGKFHQYDPWFLVNLYQLIKLNKPDVIHSSLWFANFMARVFGKILNIPVIATIHSPISSNSSQNNSQVKNNTQNLHPYNLRTLADKLTAHWAQVTVAVSASTAQQMQQVLPKLKNLMVITNGIGEFKAFSRNIPRLRSGRAVKKVSLFCGSVKKVSLFCGSVKKVSLFCGSVKKVSLFRSSRSLSRDVAGTLTIPANSFVIGTVGRLVASKNYTNLITSFAKLQTQYHNLILIIIGSGELELSLRSQVQSLNLGHKILFVQTTQALNYYKYFDCFVQPSYYEGLSMALLEAGLFKLPVIVSTNLNLNNNNFVKFSNQAASLNLHDVITNNYNGLLIDPYKLVELELALEKLILAPKLRKTLGDNLFKTVSRDFSLIKMVGAYKKLYLECARVYF
jgi:glycosyltransferase involved in cell wall biosynthesis